ncbi:hypothetical protein DDO12_11805 [Vibrio cholerae]|nr:hypothetical protein [Vibrio cholerae]EGR2511779.1 hypothetical protein [Vibrio cholerae]EGR3947082.1 hypothetical protein [Vibrio cholerae]EGR4226738.1 hypothetical protein [Vibrio cholerae]EGR4327968.1 hypothetical protein [Vibrio cholerae]
MADDRIFPFLVEAAAVLATFVHPNHSVYLCLWGMNSLCSGTVNLAAYLQHQVVWVYIINVGQN